MTRYITITVALIFTALPVHAAIYELPPEGQDVIGEISTVVATYDDTLVDIARRHGLGYQDVVRANPDVNVWLPGEGTEIILPNRFVLPPAPRKGLILNLAADPRWRCHFVVTPDSFDGRERFWPLSCPVLKQGTGDLGARMGRAFNAMPPGPTVLVGSDIPELTPRHIAQAFTALGRNQAVFGPAEDGGYWLVGLSARARHASPFQNVSWSSSEALANTMGNLAGRSIAVMETLSDIDVGADHTRWRTRCRDRS